jgi:hypothetical protein
MRDSQPFRRVRQHMTTRTRRKQITFSRSFHLRIIDAVLPAGTYEVDVDEEMIDGLSVVAYRRNATWIHLPSIETKAACREMILVQPSELAAGTESQTVKNQT